MTKTGDPVATSTQLVSLEEQYLDSKGFTNSGKKRFTKTVCDYADQLLSRALQYGNVDKAADMDVEVTHDHVRASAQSLFTSSIKPPVNKWLIAGNLIEYIATALAGIGGGHLTEAWGILTFGVFTSIAVILVVVRMMNGKD